jgi:hypothetical protein
MSTLNRNSGRDLIVARKSKTEAAGLDKIRKTKAARRLTPAKAKKATSPKKHAVERIEVEAAPVPANTFDPSDVQIQTRAYFISERRRRFALPGDANSDWLEAKRQLLAEVRY